MTPKHLATCPACDKCPMHSSSSNDDNDSSCNNDHHRYYYIFLMSEMGSDSFSPFHGPVPIRQRMAYSKSLLVDLYMFIFIF